ncbi:MAG: HPF/RaiA family ribosome-associated protein [Bdellovibrionales bacterium]|nr:HPF/RaiA family ribosome-associated protein [Bdellovibrionales bacterium]
MKFIDSPASQALDLFVQKHAGTLVRRISKSHGRYKVSFLLRPIARKRDASVKVFKFVGNITIRGGGQLRAEEKASDPRDAALKVIRSLEKQLRRLTEKQERSRKTVGKSLKPIRELRWQIEGDAN